MSDRPPPETSGTRPVSRDAKEIGAQLVDELWMRARTSLPAFFVVLLVAWPIVRGPAATSDAILVTYDVALVLAFVRWMSALWVTRNLSAISRPARYWLSLLGALANGIALGVLDTLLYRKLDPLGLGLWITFIAGIAGGATVSLGARPEIFFAYVTPAVGAFIVAPLVWPRKGIAVVPIAMTIWMIYSLAQVTQYKKSRQQFLQLNLELDANVRRLNLNNEELARKNIELVEMGQRADRIFSALGEALPGKVLSGKYMLESRIGSGGFSIVFRGTHVDLQRPVAVKIFRPRAGNDSAASLERFRYEGMASSRVHHPNLVDVMDAGISTDGIPYIAMELLDGDTLEMELAKNERIELSRIARLMEQACRGLDAAHSAGIIHRDVKPENIFLHHERDREIVKMLDFGIAKVVDAGRLENAHLTSTGDFVGTPYYMAPERLLGRECDASADVYGVGVILFRALAGRLPFEGTVGEIMMQVVSKRPPDVATLVPALPAEIARAIMQTLDDDPRKRPSASELAAILARVPVSVGSRVAGVA